MNNREKRTTTEPGLGQVSAEAGRTGVRGRILPGDDGALISTPPSSAPPSAPPSARHTRAIESVPAGDRVDERKPIATKPVDTRAIAAGDHIALKPEGAKPVDRRAPTQRDYQGEVDDGSLVTPREPPRTAKPAAVMHSAPKGTMRVNTQALDAEERAQAKGRVERTRAADGTAHTPRSPGVESAPVSSRSGASRPARPISRPPIEGRPRQSERPGSRTVDGRPLGSRPPNSPPKPPNSPPKPPNSPPKPLNSPPKPLNSQAKPARPAGKSIRQSIRVDDVGAAVSSVGDALSVTSRQVPKLVRTKAEIAAAPIDHRAGFLLAHIDGVTTVQGLVDIAAMPEKEVHEILERLRRLGIVAVR